MSKAQRAAEAIAANPQKSDRALADEIGVGRNTVSRARGSTIAGLAVTASNTPAAAKFPDEDDEEVETPRQDAKGKHNAFLVFSNEAMRLAVYDGPVDQEVIDAAKDTASAAS